MTTTPCLNPHRQWMTSINSHRIVIVFLSLGAYAFGQGSPPSTVPLGDKLKTPVPSTQIERPATAKGITFVTLEDETASANLIVRPAIWERHYQVARTATAYIATGKLQNPQGVVHVLVTRLDDLHTLLGKVRSVSRDFH